MKRYFLVPEEELKRLLIDQLQLYYGENREEFLKEITDEIKMAYSDIRDIDFEDVVERDILRYQLYEVREDHEI